MGDFWAGVVEERGGGVTLNASSAGFGGAGSFGAGAEGNRFDPDLAGRTTISCACGDPALIKEVIGRKEGRMTTDPARNSRRIFD
jgi:hypothetical protein